MTKDLLLFVTANNILMADPRCENWPQSQTCIKLLSSDWLSRDILASDWLTGVIKYQCRTLIITFLPGLNITTCLHLSHQDHSNIGSLILANRCLLALLHHNTISTHHIPLIALMFCLAQLWSQLLMWWCYLVWLSDQHSGRYWLTLGIITQHYPAIYHAAHSNQGLLSHDAPMHLKVLLSGLWCEVLWKSGKKTHFS